MEWKFKKLTRDDTKTNPSHVNFFRDEKLSSEVDSLVREDIQNRLDARNDPGQPVEVRYRLSGPGEQLVGAEVTKWLSSLQAHVQSSHVVEELEFPPEENESMSFLVVEDFNTKGLQGDWEVFNDPSPESDLAERNDFYWFIRNVGRSAKRENDRGRWGLGKIVYPACSRIRSFFALSVRLSDGCRFLTGRSVLPIHTFDGEWFSSEGYFGLYDSDESYFCIPASQADLVDDFADTFKADRGDLPGTSLVIPFPVESVSVNSLCESVLRYYFWEIINGRLEVRVESDTESHLIGKETIAAEIPLFESATYDPVKMKALYEFAVGAAEFDFSGAEYFKLNADSLKWSDAESWISVEQLMAARNALLSERQLCFEIPVKVRRKGGEQKESYFHVYLQSDSSLHGAEEEFIRDGLTIAGQKVLANRGIRSLVVAEDGFLAVLLGDSENPAHTKWIGADLKGKYVNGPATVSFVRNASKGLMGLLVESNNERDDELLTQFFGVPIDSPPKPRPIPNPEIDVVPSPDPPAPPSDSPFYSLTQSEDGFRLKSSPNDKTRETRDFSKYGIRVRCAYEGGSGNPLKAHSRFDFDLQDPGQIKLDGDAAAFEFVTSNEIRVYPESKDFDFQCSGFDPNRDLYIKAERFDVETEEEA